jgi:hypothetical protein
MNSPAFPYSTMLEEAKAGIIERSKIKIDKKTEIMDFFMELFNGATSFCFFFNIYMKDKIYSLWPSPFFFSAFLCRKTKAIVTEKDSVIEIPHRVESFVSS